jgi:ubiquinone/menaquinone biosynthesis C-methylase UbiE
MKKNTNFEKLWRMRFEAYALRRDDDAGIAGWSQFGLETRLRHFQNVWPKDKPGNIWLDVGCGAGTYARYLGESGITVLGADYSEPTVHKAKERGSGKISWFVGDVNKLPLLEESVDGILCFGVIQALSGSSEAVNEMARVVRREGAVWIDGLNGRCIPTAISRLKRWLRRRPMHLRYESPAILMKLLKEQGFEDLRYYWVPILPARVHRFQPLLETGLATWLFRFVPLIGSLFCHAYVVTGKK